MPKKNPPQNKKIEVDMILGGKPVRREVTEQFVKDIEKERERIEYENTHTIKNGTPVYNIIADVSCTSCGNIGAIQYVGDIVDGKLSHAIGFGGIIPYECMKCHNSGLIGVGGLEGYKKAFENINK